MSPTDQIVSRFFALSRSDQETALRALVLLSAPRLVEQLDAYLVSLAQPVRTPAPAPAGAAPDGGEAAALGKNTDLVSTVTREEVAKVPSASDALRRGQSQPSRGLSVPPSRVVAARRGKTQIAVTAITVDQAAARLGISVAALEREIRCGRFPPPVKVGRQRRVLVAQLQAFINQFGPAKRLAPYKFNWTRGGRTFRMDREMVRLHSELLQRTRRGGRFISRAEQQRYAT